MTDSFRNTPQGLSCALTRDEVLATARTLFNFYGWNNEGDVEMRRRIEKMRDMALLTLSETLERMPTDQVIAAICKWMTWDYGDKAMRAEASELYHVIQNAAAQASTAEGGLTADVDHRRGRKRTEEGPDQPDHANAEQSTLTRTPTHEPTATDREDTKRDRGDGLASAAAFSPDKEWKPRSGYVMLTQEEVERIRVSFQAFSVDADQAKRLTTLCDMAINALLYADEIHRLRSAVSARGLTSGDPLVDGDLLCAALGIQRTEGGSLNIGKMVTAIKRLIAVRDAAMPIADGSAWSNIGGCVEGLKAALKQSQYVAEKP